MRDNKILMFFSRIDQVFLSINLFGDSLSQKIYNRNNASLWVRLALTVILCLGLSSQAKARIKVKELDETIIRAFIQKTSEITSGRNLSMSQSDIQDFLDRHLHEKARFRSVIQFQIPGFPPQSNAMALDKSQFMSKIADGAQKLEDYYNEVQVIDIQISSDKRKATVQTIGQETGVMSIPAQDGSIQKMPVEGRSSCHQIITISRRDVVQMYNANCETQITFQ